MRWASRHIPRGRRRVLYGLGAAALGEGLPLWLRTHRLGGEMIVRCRDGHLFSTLWIPGVSAKSLRLGPWRVQRCPVGNHWTIVTPVRETELSKRQRRAAQARHDIRIP